MAASGGGSRAFSVSDAMILVAASGLAILGFRLTSDKLRWDLSDPGQWVVWVPDLLDWLAFVLAPGLMIIRLRSPRPGRARLWRQPGWVVCFAIVITFALETLEFLGIYFVQEMVKEGSSGLSLSTIFLEVLPLHAPDDISRAVIAIWAILGLSGRWKAERSPVDRLGRIIGWYWAARAVASPLVLLATT